MKIQKIRLSGIGPYTAPAELDLDAIGAGLIAVSGGNGQGKTTLLSALPGALYSTTPDRGPIAQMATARDAFIELQGDQGGHAFRVVQSFDAVSGKREALLEWDGEPVGGPKVREFQAAIESRFPPYSVFLAASFSAQSGAGSLLRMDRASRRDLFARLLQLDNLERLAAAAREKAKACESDLLVARAALEAIRGGTADVVGLEASLLSARGDAARASGSQRDAQDRLRSATAARDRLTAAMAEAQRAERTAQEAQRRAEQAAEALARLERQAEALAPILSQRDAIRAHAEALRTGEAELATLTAKAQAADVEAKRAGTAAAEARQRASTAVATERDLRARLAALDGILAEAPAIREQATKLAALTADLERLRADGEAAAAAERSAMDVLRVAGENLAGVRRAAENARQRHDAEAEALERAREALDRARASARGFPCASILDDATRATCPAIRGHLQAAKAAEAELARLQGAMPEIEQETEATRKAAECAAEQRNRASGLADAAKEAADALRLRYRDLNAEASRLRTADRSAELARAEAEEGALRPGLEAAEKAARDAGVVADVDENAGVSAMYAALDTGKQRDALSARLADLRRSDRSAALAQAEADSAALGGRLEAARADAQARAREAMEAGAAVPAVRMAEIGVAEQAAEAADKAAQVAAMALQEAERQVARLEAQLEAAREAQAKAEALVAKVTPLERDLSDWRFISRGLGREGVQALELDAAGPRVSDLCNELLREGYGGRFSVRLETQAAKADGKGVKETFDVVVCDNERGREGNGEDLSGGEKVVVGEALGLAVGLFHSQASGVELGTVVRDETVGALDPENAERYLAMLRAFLRVGRVHQLLFVAHQSALVDLADAVVRVENGRIEVRA